MKQNASLERQSPNWLGLCVDLDGRNCLIVGGGRVAERRCQQLCEAGAQVSVVAPDISAGIVATTATTIQRRFKESDLDGKDLIVVASNDHTLNGDVVALARKKRIWVNATHQSEDGDLLFPATVQRGDLQINVSTGGRAPALGKYLINEISTRYGSRWAGVVSTMAAWRDKVKQVYQYPQHPDSSGRISRFWHRLMQGDFVEMLLSGRGEDANAYLQELLTSERDGKIQTEGCVYLVGAGPGDQRLLTLRAFDILQRADVVLYDRLVSAQVLGCIPGHIEMICVGKERERELLGQKSINELMIEHARSGRAVVRLKGGDPFIFGRGGEEMSELARHRIRFQVVPGISAANGCACYFGIPLTHRDYAHSCVLMTAHRRSDAGEIDWAALRQPMQTVVLYMGNYRLVEVATKLKENGFSGTHPIALISNGTTEQEKIWVGCLDEVIEYPPELPSPALAILGDVVGLNKSLNWRTSPRSETVK